MKVMRRFPPRSIRAERNFLFTLYLFSQTF
nr:MAG TPA: hypothetical protein [Caudoviricetes sp.]